MAFATPSRLAEHQAAGGGEGRNQVERRRTRGPVMAAARGFAVNGEPVGTIRPALAHPGGADGLEQRRMDPVHQDGQPAPAGHTRRGAAQKVQVCLAPGGDMVIVVAVGEAAADPQQQDLWERIEDAADIARILDLRQVLEQDGKTGPLRRVGDHS
ncbi:MAG: hypothetical protein JOY91_05500 [Sinobacteraceae bacterium]|nr:hypothetical protein [Nevskiaceae bacterium]